MTTLEMPPTATELATRPVAEPAGDVPKVGRLVDQFEKGLDAPICLTWD